MSHLPFLHATHVPALGVTRICSRLFATTQSHGLISRFFHDSGIALTQLQPGPQFYLRKSRSSLLNEATTRSFSTELVPLGQAQASIDFILLSRAKALMIKLVSTFLPSCLLNHFCVSASAIWCRLQLETYLFTLSALFIRDLKCCAAAV